MFADTLLFGVNVTEPSLSLDIEPFRSSLLRWFRHNGRELPWRNGYDPYHVWLSEIMLQQTQMERGVDYFRRWLRRFPDIVSVAGASSYEILKYWEGLGYYARARNLHKAAKVMAAEYGGAVPDEYETLLRLPGIGPYTAAAIASIAFNHDVVVVDANVERVFARLFDIDVPLKEKEAQRSIGHIARQLLPPGEARDFNQALMDLGGLVCTPKNPDCGNCPLCRHCSAYLGDFTDDRPVKKRRQKIIPIDMATGLLVKDGYIFIQQRHDNDIWGGMWEFPGGRLEPGETADEAVVREYREETGFQIEVCDFVTTVTHFHTKYKVTLHCFLCRLPSASTLPELHAAQNYHWVRQEQLDNFGFPAGHRKFIQFLRANRLEYLRREC